MKLNFKILVGFNVVVVLLCLTQIYDLFTQLNDRTLLNWMVTRKELHHPAAPNEYAIPKIIHQTYKTEDIPAEWHSTQESVKNMNPDYEYILWTDKSAREFLEQHYPWFVSTFDGYPHPIMRADALRYFVLYHYGGFYIDLDIGARASFDPLRQLSSAFYKTNPVGVSNGFMGVCRSHPFMLKLIKSLEHYNRYWFLPYLTVMYSTGPLFVSILLQGYNWGKTIADKSLVRIYPMNDNNSIYQPLTDFVYQVSGSTWHEGDARLFLFIANNKALASLLITLFVLATVGIMLFLELQVINCILSMSRYRVKVSEMTERLISV